MDETPGHREEMLRAFLEHTDESCPSCGYGLRGLKTAICPECGEQLRLYVGRETPAAGWYTAGTVGISSALAIHLAALVFVGPYEFGVAQALLPGTALALLALVGWIRGRRRVAQASVLTRSVLTSGAIVLPVFLVILTAILVGTLGP